MTLLGRLTRDPDVRRNGDTVIVRYTLAVDRRFKRDGDPTADFINCVCFGKGAEFAEKYLRKGIKIAVVGRIQTGSYTNQQGDKVYTTDVVVEEQEFAESKAASQNSQPTAPPQNTYQPQSQTAPAPNYQQAPQPQQQYQQQGYAPQQGYAHAPQQMPPQPQYAQAPQQAPVQPQPQAQPNHDWMNVADEELPFV